MKPTKEQLADPNWWEINSNGYDYMFYHEGIGEYEFTNKDGKSKDISLVINSDAWRLLAKRPEPEHWKPKAPSLPDIGTEVDILDNGSLVYGQGESGEVIGHIENCAIVRMSYGLGCFEASYLKIKKTQREELIDLIYISSEIELDAAAATASIILGKYDLTEKDGN